MTVVTKLSTASDPVVFSITEETIKRGELYSYQAGKFEGDFFTVILCGSCHRDRNAIHEAELARGCRASAGVFVDAKFA